MSNPAIPPKKRKNTDAILATVLLITVLFEIFLTVLLLIRSYSDPIEPNNSTPTDDIPVIDTTEEEIKSPIVSDATVDLAGDALVTSKYALLLNADTWEVVAQKNADVRFSPASMTKVMTLLVALEELEIRVADDDNRTLKDELDRELVYSQDVVHYVSTGEYAGTSFSLPRDDPNKPDITYMGDRFTLRAMLYGIGVSSAADCTYMVIREISGTEDAFVALMNEKATALGLQNTHFSNAVGFDSADNYTTAADMAVIMQYAMQNELIADILKVRTEEYKIKGYYNENGEQKSYDVSLKPSINSRLKYYEEFALTTSVLEATKTGFTTGSYMVCSVVSKSTGTRYVLVLGEADAPKATQGGKFKDTMLDIEYICNTYIK